MKPNCMKCKHFYITFDQRTPRGCKIYGIQSQSLPSMIVKQANGGSECIGFSPKPQKENTEKKKDLNDAKYW